MHAVVLVDHGSREPRANAQLEEMATRLRERMPGRLVTTAHMELAEPSLGEAIDACAAEGAREIVVAPCFVALGRHAAEDIPRLAEEAARRHAGVTVRVAEPLGVHPGVVDALVDRVSAGGDPSRSG